MKNLVSKAKVFIFGERTKGEFINLDQGFKPMFNTQYPAELIKPSQNDWMRSLKVSSRVPKYTNTGSVIL